LRNFRVRVTRTDDERLDDFIALDRFDDGIGMLSANATVHDVLGLHDHRNAVAAHVETASPARASEFLREPAPHETLLQSGKDILRALLGT
jgi:hypothetical protein